MVDPLSYTSRFVLHGISQAGLRGALDADGERGDLPTVAVPAWKVTRHHQDSAAHQEGERRGIGRWWGVRGGGVGGTSRELSGLCVKTRVTVSREGRF